jgi:hypothetical protein
MVLGSGTGVVLRDRNQPSEVIFISRVMSQGQ